jgi:uncharacterized protein
VIVFDTSTILSAALFPKSVPGRALLHALRKEVIALSAPVYDEIAGVLARPKFADAYPPARRERMLELLRKRGAWFQPTVTVSVCRDFRDNKFLELAQAAGAEYLVTSDNDLLVLQAHCGTAILTPARYLGLVERPFASAITPTP